MSNLGETYKDLGRYTKALKLHEKVFWLRKAKLGYDHVDTLVSMANVAESLAELKRGDEALPIIDDCLKRATHTDIERLLVPPVTNLRMRLFREKSSFSGCLETADKWEALKRTDRDSLYQAARFRAVCSAVFQEDASADGQAAKEQADMAMSWLHKAVKAGYKDVEHMKQDKDLAVLRERDDFKKLVAEMEKQMKEP